MTWSLWSIPWAHAVATGAEVGNGLSYFPQGFQQSAHPVLRVNASFLVGQVNAELSSSQLGDDPRDYIRAALTGHVRKNSCFFKILILELWGCLRTTQNSDVSGPAHSSQTLFINQHL